MNVTLKPFDFAQAAARAGLRTDGTPLNSPATGIGAGVAGAGGADAAQGANFQTAMAEALRQVSDMQLESSGLQREVQLDNPTVSIEQTMIAMNKSQVGFQAALTVRNRLVQAYSEIMNMQV